MNSRPHHRKTVSYFVEDDRLGRKERDRVEIASTAKTLWRGEWVDLRLVTTVYDDTTAAVACYFLRVPIVDGKSIVEDHVQTAILHRTLAKAQALADLTLEYDRQMAGFSNDWGGQLARALNVNVSAIANKRSGEPLLTTATTGKAIQQAERMHADSNRMMAGQ